MTYSVDGRQYIIVAVSGGNYSGEYIAFALPASATRGTAEDARIEVRSLKSEVRSLKCLRGLGESSDRRALFLRREQRRNHRQQFGGIDRLGQVPLEAGVERAQAIFGPGVRGQRDRRRGGRVPAFCAEPFSISP